MLKYNKKLTPIARDLRKEMTAKECKLWYNFLKNYPIRIRRQKVIANFIADFYCAKAKLIIELDGKQHLSQENSEYDTFRSDYIKTMNIEVIRFSNDEVNSNFDIVCAKIDYEIQNRITNCTKTD